VLFLTDELNDVAHVEGRHRGEGHAAARVTVCVCVCVTVCVCVLRFDLRLFEMTTADRASDDTEDAKHNRETASEAREDRKDAKRELSHAELEEQREQRFAQETEALALFGAKKVRERVCVNQTTHEKCFHTSSVCGSTASMMA